ncbi:112aa long hypothetical protein [Pyrococcus horikoshii OT3]|uniref:Uncharacterized protein n=1 Tax=Pyrococcus horikoshii (strain ATCC 700860 / DSM 12428 / JCM 9974 / NBRC 100139 / OT-3) TaxID=70601 RepID=O58661_PYRHO|nr:112aa long hypothetical protein [Pyrococcus horikoshii OT3]
MLSLSFGSTSVKFDTTLTQGIEDLMLTFLNAVNPKFLTTTSALAVSFVRTPTSRKLGDVTIAGAGGRTFNFKVKLLVMFNPSCLALNVIMMLPFTAFLLDSPMFIILLPGLR